MTTKQGGEGKRFLVAYFAGFLFMLVGLVAAIYVISGRDFPAPAVTASISFDEKLLWLRNHPHPTPDILALGSSMSVNNLTSDFADEGKPELYLLNLGMWGMKVRHLVPFAEALLERIHPRVLLMVATPPDFAEDERGDELYPREKLLSYLDGENLILLHLRHFSWDYYKKIAKKIVKDKHTRTREYSLQFDRSGALPLALPPENISAERWNKASAIAPDDMDERNYEALRELARLAAARGILFVAMQTPLRAPLIGEKESAFLAKHWARVETICREEGGYFFNLHEELGLGDELFADYGHLNGEGPILTSKAALAHVEEILQVRAAR